VTSRGKGFVEISPNLLKLFFHEEHDDIILHGWEVYVNNLYFLKTIHNLSPKNWDPYFDQSLGDQWREEDINILMGIGRVQTAKMLKDQRERKEKTDEDERKANANKLAAEAAAYRSSPEYKAKHGK